MPGLSPKAVCFNTAVSTLQALNGMAGSPLPFTFDTQMPWTKNFGALGTSWQPVEAGPFKQWYYIYGYLKNKMGAGLWQVRYPDATVTYPNGTRQVYDTKFTQGNGRPDVWGTQPGQHSKATQLQDYNAINREQGHPTLGPPELSRAECKCDEREKNKQLVPRPVHVPEFSPFFVPYPNPGEIPSRVPSPGRLPGPIRLPPIRVPVWVP